MINVTCVNNCFTSELFLFLHIHLCYVKENHVIEKIVVELSTDISVLMSTEHKQRFKNVFHFVCCR